MEHEPLLHHSEPVGGRSHPWWRGAVIYQVYPRSFQDSDGDGIGDLAGITSRLDYIAGLGVDALWISPFFTSPQKDYGYDVADYRGIDPQFGTEADFDALLEKAHSLGLRVLLDFVPAHTSDQHPWFAQSRASRDGPKSDWYVWADAKPDGMPPNNWLSVFGGVGWTWEHRRRQYYCHHFLKEQPALNLWNPEVTEALLAEARFWLERGVDGFRIDAVDYALADRELRDNPPRQQPALGPAAGSPFSMQHHLYDYARPELGEQLLKPFWRMSERYEGVVLLGEVTGETALRRAPEYTQGGGLDMAYTFDLLLAPPDANGIRAVVERLEASIGQGWMCWSFGNHDIIRAATRFGGADCPLGLRRLIPILLCSLRGTLCLYQGEELGLDEAELAFEDLRDPYGIAFWPEFKGRDGCRTPMPWRHDQAHGAFTTGRPWLPLPPSHLSRAVDLQEGRHGSVLATTRRFLHWRRDCRPLREGSMAFLEADPAILAFERSLSGERVIAVFNMSPTDQRFAAAGLGPAGFATDGVELAQGSLNLPAFGLGFLRPCA